jgi:hypothetical protein
MPKTTKIDPKRQRSDHVLNLNVGFIRIETIFDENQIAIDLDK